MIQKFKQEIKKNKFLKIIFTYLLSKNLYYRIIYYFNIPFKFKLSSNKKVALYPKGQIASIIYSRQFEVKELISFQKLIKDGMIVIDAGANIGLYSIIASKLVGPQGTVISFEPSKETFERLQNNIILNNALNIIPFNCGLGDQDNQKLFLRQDLGYEDAERYLIPMNHNLNQELQNVGTVNQIEDVKIETLDNILTSKGVTKIDFLKIDTEGYEYYILKGAEKILSNSKDLIILMECTELGTKRANTSQKDVFEILFRHGYQIFYWNTESNTWSSDEEGLFRAGDVWACRNINLLNI